MVCGGFQRIEPTVADSGDHGDAQIELALDRGVLLGGGKEAPLCEVELELKSGSEETLVALAEAIAREFSLSPEPKSKFQRAREL